MLSRLTLQPLVPPVLVLLLSLVGIAASLWLYRRQLGDIISPWHLAIPVIRAIGVFAITSALLRPSVIRPKSISEFGPLVVLVDVSRSMGVKDAGRTVGQRVELAEALGMLPEGARRDATGEFRAGLEKLSSLFETAILARSELDYAKLSARSPEAAQANVDRRMLSLAEHAERLAARAPVRRGEKRIGVLLTEIGKVARAPSSNWLRSVRDRLAQVSAIVSEQQSGVDERLYRNSPAVHEASDSVGGMSRLELIERLLRGHGGLLAALGDQTPNVSFTIGDRLSSVELPQSDSTASILKPLADRSNLTGGLAEVRRRLQGLPKVGIVMFSDGRQVGAEGDVATALGTAQTPVFTIAAAGPIKRDIAITRVLAPARAIAGETLFVRVDVTATGDKIDSVPVSVELGNSKASQPMTMKDGRGSITLAVEANGSGIQKLLVSSPPSVDESSIENNSVERRVKVSGEKLKVALLATVASKEYTYIQGVLSRLPWVGLTDRIIVPSTGPELRPQTLFQQDVTILCDVSAAALDDAQWDALRRSVDERGAAAIITAGDGFVTAHSIENPVYKAFLPFATQSPAWRVWPSEEPAFRFTPVGGAEANPVLEENADSAQASRRWNQMSPVLRYLPVLDLKPDTLPLLIERDSGTPMFTESRLGAGRAYFLGVSETWRWAVRKDGRDVDLFWPRLMRNAAEPAYAVTNAGISLDVDPLIVTSGKPISVRAKRLDSTTAPTIPSGLNLDLMHGEEVVSQAKLNPIESSPKTRFTGELLAPEPGEYTVRLREIATGESIALPLTVESTASDELRNLNGDDGLLRRIAESSGGEMLRLDETKSLPAKIAAARERQPQFIEYRLWDSPYFFLLVLGCFGIEWALRKRIGMA